MFELIVSLIIVKIFYINFYVTKFIKIMNRAYSKTDDSYIHSDCDFHCHNSNVM